MNIGERNEYFAKFLLVDARDHQISVPGIGVIQSVGFAGNEYGALPNGYTITSVRDRSIAIWTHYRDNSYKGSLHVRLIRPDHDNE